MCPLYHKGIGKARKAGPAYVSSGVVVCWGWVDADGTVGFDVGGGLVAPDQIVKQVGQGLGQPK